MDLVGATINRLYLLKFLYDIRITRCRDESREPIEAGHDPVFHFAGRNMTWPANDSRDSESTFKNGPFSSRKWRLASIRPGKILRSIIGGKCNDRILIKTIILEVF